MLRNEGRLNFGHFKIHRRINRKQQSEAQNSPTHLKRSARLIDEVSSLSKVIPLGTINLNSFKLRRHTQMTKNHSKNKF